MSENMTPSANQPQNEEPSAPQEESSRAQGSPATDLATELREMAQQLEAAFRAALESERTKQLQRDLAGGVRELNNQLQAALRSLQTNPHIQQAEERGRQAISQAKQSKIVQDVQETVASGFAQLNEQLRKLVDRLESERASQQPSGPTTQQIPVEHENPTMGETTRLDDSNETGR